MTMSTEWPGAVNVAIVDDDESFRRAFARLLRASGMTPFPFGSAEEFLAVRAPPKFDCLVLDIQLPGMAGRELYRQLNSLGYGTPVIFVTACDDARFQGQAHATSCAGYFRKSDSGKDVTSAIRHTLGAGRLSTY
jgi:FixJ family two-component response regulator